MIFKGTFEHSLDAKHRLTIPSKFRAAFADGAVIAVSPEISAGDARAVSIWTPQAHETFITDMTAGYRAAGPTARDLKRIYLAHAFDAELDSAHRLMIPASLMKLAQLDTKVTITGVGECLEVWNPDEYQRYLEGAFSRISDITASLDHTP